jgi:hypothetical protein
MTINNRSILGPANPYDDGKLPASAVDGQQQAASTVIGDQQSLETETRRDATVSAYRHAETLAGKIGSDAGAGGEQIGRGPDRFTTTGTAPTDGGTGIGTVTDAGGPLVTRDNGADDPRGSAYGKAVG